MKSWIGVDLDGTLSYYPHLLAIGRPIEPMADMVKAWIADGIEVRIFTARASAPEPLRSKMVKDIEEWCLEHLGKVLPVTCSKDFQCAAIYDDIAHHVDHNTGRICQE